MEEKGAPESSSASEVASEPVVPTETAVEEPAPTQSETQTSQDSTPTAQIQPDEPIAEEVSDESLPDLTLPDSSLKEVEAPEALIPEPPPPQEVPAPEPPQTPPASSAPVSVIAPIIHSARDLAAKARAVIQSRKRKKLDKILELLATKKNIGNDDVEKLLRVSDATATRYLQTLEKEGKIIQVGKTGKAVRYVLTS